MLPQTPSAPLISVSNLQWAAGSQQLLLKLFRHTRDHLKRLVALIPVLVFFISIHKSEVTSLQGRLLPLFVDQGTREKIFRP